MPELRFKDLHMTVVESGGKLAYIVIPVTTPTCAPAISSKEDLRAVLSKAEGAAEIALKQNQQPQTVQEVEMLEKPLEAILKELSVYKEGLKKSAA